MRAMILAAGRGQRMGELSREIPKPLLKVNNKFLIEYSLRALVHAKVTSIVINVAYHGEKIQAAIGNNFEGIEITYSVEDPALETGGGIFQALPLLGQDPFIVISADIITDFPLQKLSIPTNNLAHLVLVNNPDFHPRGDYDLVGNKVCRTSSNPFTFASVGIYHPNLFDGCSAGVFPLSDVLNRAIVAKKVTGEVYSGAWHNVGTPGQIHELNRLEG